MSARARLAALAAPAALAVLAAFTAPAAAGPPSSVAVHGLRITGGDRQEAWVTVLDGAGAPVEGLEPRAFAIEHDGRAVEDLTITPWADHYRGRRLTLAVDPDLLAGEGGRALSALLRVLAREAPAGSRLALVSLGGRARRVETPMSDAASAADRFAEWSGDEARAPFWDRVVETVRAAARAPRGEASTVLLVTRGRDAGGRRGPLDAVAFAETPGRPVRVSVLLVGESGEADRLGGLAARSGGALSRVADPGGLGRRAEDLLARARGAYRLAYRVRGWDAAEPRHTLTASVEGAAGRRSGALTYATADVLPEPWWRNPLPWVMLVALLALAGAGFLVARPRRLCRLVVRGGEESGCSYEVYGLPVTLGAALGNDLVFPEGRVSRNHAVLERRGSAIELSDLNSENGTFVNGDRITRRRLAQGDRIRLGGSVELTYEGRG